MELNRIPLKWVRFCRLLKNSKSEFHGTTWPSIENWVWFHGTSIFYLSSFILQILDKKVVQWLENV